MDFYTLNTKNFEKEKNLKESCELQKISNVFHKWTEPGISLAKRGLNRMCSAAIPFLATKNGFYSPLRGGFLVK